MVKQKYVERNGCMRIKYKEEENGTMKTKIKAASNFVFQVIAPVVGAKSGYIVEVVIFRSNGERYV